MYVVAILLMCAMSILSDTVSAYEAFKVGKIASGVFHTVVMLLFFTLAIIIFTIRDRRDNFELDLCDDDDCKTRSLKEAGGYVFAIAVILVIAMWFCQLGGII